MSLLHFWSVAKTLPLFINQSCESVLWSFFCYWNQYDSYTQMGFKCWLISSNRFTSHSHPQTSGLSWLCHMSWSEAMTAIVQQFTIYSSQNLKLKWKIYSVFVWFRVRKPKQRSTLWKPFSLIPLKEIATCITVRTVKFLKYILYSIYSVLVFSFK